MLLVVCAGCLPRPRRGVIIRGDWSLEMNRVPWVASRRAADQECSETDADGWPGRLTQGEMSAWYPCEPHTAAQSDVDHTSASAAESGSACSFFQRRGRLGVTDYVQPAAALTSRAHSRFHPVPTRPVFLPRPDPFQAAGNDAHWQGADTSDSSCPHDNPAPMPPELEVIPLPEPKIDEGWPGGDSGMTNDE